MHVGVRGGSKLSSKCSWRGTKMTRLKESIEKGIRKSGRENSIGREEKYSILKNGREGETQR